MLAKTPCPECGSELPPDAPHGLCPSCLARLARAPVPQDMGAPSAGLPRRFGDYMLIEEIARGGMGVVFKARQSSLNRTVAIKMILAGQLASTGDVKRFHAEAQAAANLQHPNVVAIHEVGQVDGQNFFSMDYVAGPNLADLVRERPLPARQAAKLVQIVAGAIQYSHERGILHRDLKPSNVLLDANGQPRVTDFGLAKRYDGPPPYGIPALGDHGAQGLDEILTLTGQVLGSPNFMPPEQAVGKHEEITPASDVYSLGAILYHLLTGRPPFLAGSLTDTLHQVAHSDPVAPRLLNSAIPTDLETICLKCLEKAPAKRYPVAQALAAELDRFQRGDPILARPVSRPEKLWRWARRNPGVAGLSAALAAVLGLAFAGVLWQLQLARAKSEQDRQRLVRLNVTAGTRIMDEGDVMGSLPWFVQALSLDEGHPAEEKIHRLRIGTALSRCPKLLQVFNHSGRIHHAEFSPEGLRIVTASADRTAQVWHAGTRTPLGRPLEHGQAVVHACFSPDGRRVATASLDKTVRVWEAATGQPLTRALQHSFEVRQVAFDPDGRRLVSVSSIRDVPGEVRVWDAETGQALTPPLIHAFEVNHAMFSPDGQWLLTASGSIDRGGEIRLWDAATGALLTNSVRAGPPVWRVSFSRDGRRIVTAAGDFMVSGEARVWDAVLGQMQAYPMRHRAQVNGAEFSPDGSRIVTASYDNTARVWDATTGEPIGTPLQHDSPVAEAVFSPDGRWVLTASFDRTTRLWEAASGQPLGPALRHLGAVSHASFSPEGRRILTTSDDQMVRLWDLASLESAMGKLSHQGIVRHASFSPDGHLVVTGAGGGQCRLWDTGPAGGVKELRGHTRTVIWIDFSPNGRRLVTASYDHTAQLWDTATGLPATPPLSHSNVVYYALFSPDGRQVATASWDDTVRLWDAATGAPITPPLAHLDWVFQVDFSPDGRQLVAACGRNAFAAKSEVRVWDTATGEARTLPLQHRDAIATVFFSPEGRRIVTASDDQTARVWDATTGQPLSPPLEHNGWLYVARFSPEGRRVVTASTDNTARVWDADTGVPLTPPLSHHGAVTYAQFSHDGRLVLTTSWDSTARVWDAATGTPVTPPLRHDQKMIEYAEFSGDDRNVVTAGWDRTARLWALSEADRPTAELRRLAQVMAGRQWTPGGDLASMKPETVLGTLESLRDEDSGDFEVGTRAMIDWHRRSAEASEAAGQSFAAAFHLDRLLATAPQNEALRRRHATARAEVTTPNGQTRETARLIPPRDTRATARQINLTDYYNAALTTTWHPGSGGNDLSELPRGLQTFAGTEFDVRGVVQLAGRPLKELTVNGAQTYPAEVRGIAVGLSCRRLHWFHGTGWRETDGTRIGSLVLRYAKGYEVAVPLIYGQDVRDWWASAEQEQGPKRATVAWAGHNAATRRSERRVQLFKSTWENPLPNEVIECIDYVSAMTDCAPFLIAITVE